jgi:hypothetical protein
MGVSRHQSPGFPLLTSARRGTAKPRPILVERDCPRTKRLRRHLVRRRSGIFHMFPGGILMNGLYPRWP